MLLPRGSRHHKKLDLLDLRDLLFVEADDDGTTACGRTGFSNSAIEGCFSGCWEGPSARYMCAQLTGVRAKRQTKRACPGPAWCLPFRMRHKPNSNLFIAGGSRWRATPAAPLLHLGTFEPHQSMQNRNIPSSLPSANTSHRFLRRALCVDGGQVVASNPPAAAQPRPGCWSAATTVVLQRGLATTLAG